jgi:arylformamidase
MLKYKRLIDISQPVKSDSAAYPGDTPFQKEIVLTFEKSGLVNLTRLTMSPHVGTHVDAPSHIKGELTGDASTVGQMSLEPFIGPALVLDLAPCREAITWSLVEPRLKEIKQLSERVLFRTQEKIRYEVFEDSYAFFTTEVIDELHRRGVKLMGIDVPSVDRVGATYLEAHCQLDRFGMVWLESLDLCQAHPGEFYLVALPIKFMELEASPLRAVLLEF